MKATYCVTATKRYYYFGTVKQPKLGDVVRQIGGDGELAVVKGVNNDAVQLDRLIREGKRDPGFVSWNIKELELVGRRII